MTKTNSKSWLALCLSLVLVVAGIWFLGRLTQPKYMSGVLEGAMTAEYYNEKNPHDVIFIGDCEVYENFSPVTMWRECGITSYIRGTAQQLIWQSYYLLEEAFRHENPKIVVYNVQAMKYDEPQSEAYNRMALDGMRLNASKLGAIRASMMEDEEFISYLIPLLRYHSRWEEIGPEDWQYLFHRDPVTVAGYLMRADVKPMKRLPSTPILADTEIGSRCWEYLDKIHALCEQHGARLVLIKSPSIWPLHLNIYGAEKASAYFAHLLSDRFGLSDHRGDPIIAADWNGKCQQYDALLAAQLQELEEYGYLKSWTLGNDRA